MGSAMDTRIDAMLRRDSLIGVVFAVLMWLVLLFVLVTAARVIDDRAVVAVLVFACVVLGTFNSLSLLSLIRRYRAERQHVYGEDIHYLDAARAARRQRAAKPVAEEAVTR